MPEGPEVRIAADKIQRAIGQSPLVDCTFAHPSLQVLVDQFDNSTQLSSIDTYGKAFVLHFSNEVSLYVHLQLYGRWRTGTLKSFRPSNRTLRFKLCTETHYAALYSATDLDILSPDTIQQHPFIRKLGPDILRPGYSTSHISRRLNSPKFARRRLGGLMMDQSVFAGIGNYLRSEILFRAQLHHSRTLGSLEDNERTALARMIHNTTHQSYRTRGITLSPEHVETAKSQGLKRRDYRHFVFDREGESCWVCQTEIQKSMVAGRRLYWCSTCQSES